MHWVWISQKICHFVKSQPITRQQILDWSKLKQIADDILKCILNEIKVSDRVENVVRKREIACNKPFLFFSQYFSQLCIFSASKCGIVW